jgi:hypothetical protein
MLEDLRRDYADPLVHEHPVDRLTRSRSGGGVRIRSGAEGIGSARRESGPYRRAGLIIDIASNNDRNLGRDEPPDRSIEFPDVACPLGTVQTQVNAGDGKPGSTILKLGQHCSALV